MDGSGSRLPVVRVAMRCHKRMCDYQGLIADGGQTKKRSNDRVPKMPTSERREFYTENCKLTTNEASF
jgi:hypothetical protein